MIFMSKNLMMKAAMIQQVPLAVVLVLISLVKAAAIHAHDSGGGRDDWISSSTTTPRRIPDDGRLLRGLEESLRKERRRKRRTATINDASSFITSRAGEYAGGYIQKTTLRSSSGSHPTTTTTSSISRSSVVIPSSTYHPPPPPNQIRYLQEEEEDTTSATNAKKKKNKYTFAVIPKQLIEFFEPTMEGCKDHASRLSKTHDVIVECLYTAPSEAENRGIKQAQMVEDLLWGPEAAIMEIDGIAVSVVDETLMTPILNRARNELQIPVVTFDSDAPKSDRSYYIGTNNSFFGRQLARQMESLRPSGGTYAIISGESTNLQDRANGIIQELADQTANSGYTWRQLEDSPFDALNNQTLAIEKMNEWATQNPTVLLSVTGLPMRIKTITSDDGNTTTTYSPWPAFVDEHRHRDITLLCADASPHQLTFLNYDYVNGLAGQLPYDMGIRSIDTLWSLYHNPQLEPNNDGDDKDEEGGEFGDSPGSDFIGTNVVWHVHIPLKLPPITVDMNRVGNLQYIGYTLFGVIAVFALSLMAWVYWRRNVRVIQVSQPPFLFMIALGVLIMASSMIPLGMDDYHNGRIGGCSSDFEYGDDESDGRCVAICMGIPWTASIGFVLTFSAMYAKTRRINSIFHSDAGFSRVKVSESDVLPPLVALMTINVTILICWTVLDPLIYQREADHSRDEWNRVISTYGVCRADNPARFGVPLILVNFGVLCLANWQAYEARKLEEEFAETKYICICMASLLQAMISGIPLLFFVHSIPQAYYMVYVLLCFIVSMVILLVMFVPKMFYTHAFLKLSPDLQQTYLVEAIRRTARNSQILRNSQGRRLSSERSILTMGGTSSMRNISSRSSWMTQECQICLARSRIESRAESSHSLGTNGSAHGSDIRSSRRLSLNGHRMSLNSNRSNSTEDYATLLDHSTDGRRPSLRSLEGRRPSLMADRRLSLMKLDELGDEDDTSGPIDESDQDKKPEVEAFANSGDSPTVDESESSMQSSSRRRLPINEESRRGLATIAGGCTFDDDSSSDSDLSSTEKAKEEYYSDDGTEEVIIARNATFEREGEEHSDEEESDGVEEVRIPRNETFEKEGEEDSIEGNAPIGEPEGDTKQEDQIDYYPGMPSLLDLPDPKTFLDDGGEIEEQAKRLELLADHLGTQIKEEHDKETDKFVRSASPLTDETSGELHYEDMPHVVRSGETDSKDEEVGERRQMPQQ